MKPINPQNKHKNGHVFVVGMSGSGKTSAAKKLFIAPTDQVIIFDPMGDYKGKLAGRTVRGYGNVRDFTQSVIAGRKTAQGFKIAYSPYHETTQKDFDLFCQIAWAMGNGKHPKALKIICEEVAEHTETSGKATGYHGKLLRQDIALSP